MSRKTEKLTKALRENLKKRKITTRNMKLNEGDQGTPDASTPLPKLRKTLITKKSGVKLEPKE